MEQNDLQRSALRLAAGSTVVHAESLTVSSPSVLHLRAGETLIRSGDEVRGVYNVLSGRLKCLRPYGSGVRTKNFLEALLSTGDQIGLQDLLDRVRSTALTSGAVSRDTYEVVGEAVLGFEPLSSFEMWLKAYSGSPTLQIERPEKYLRKPLALMPVSARVAATLWFLARHRGASPAALSEVSPDLLVDWNLTREEIAHLAGTVYESVIRTLTILKNEGVIELEARRIRILNEQELVRLGQIDLGRSADRI